MARIHSTSFLLYASFLAGCAPMPTECELAPADEGWVLIQEPPLALPEVETNVSGRTVIWFENAALSRVIACERPKKQDAGCPIEFIETFELRDGEWFEAIFEPDGKTPLPMAQYCVY